MADEPTNEVTRLGGAPNHGSFDAAHGARVTIQGFDLIEPVGRGGMGIVYRGRDVARERPVAIKLLLGDAPSSESRERFSREARALAMLRHDAIVEYVAHGRLENGSMYLVMEWLDGHDLATELAKGPLQVADALLLGCRLADGLVAAHQAGISHRDLKPSNVFLPNGDVGHAKLIDFGVAQILDVGKGLTRTGGLVGTPGYMSPEQAQGAHDIDHRTDLFSLGCILFECVAGRPVFTGAHVLAILAKILLEDPPRLRGLAAHAPPWLDQLVETLLAKDPAGRPESAREVLEALRNEGLAAPRAQPPPRLAEREQELLSIVVVGAVTASTSAAASMDEIAATAARHAGQVVPLRDGTRLVVLHGEGTPLDRAAIAVRCALDLLEHVGPSLVAVTSGLGHLAGQSLLGRVVDAGARLLDVARRGKVVVDRTTASLVEDRFDLVPLTADAFVVTVHRPEALHDGRRVLGQRTPFVGRRRELATLEGLFAQVVEDRDPATAVVVGEAGLGKTRLRREFVQRLTARTDDVSLLIARGDPLASGSSLAILGDLVRSACGIDAMSDATARERAIRELVAIVSSDRRERVAASLARAAGIHIEIASAELRAALADPAVVREAVPEAWHQWLGAMCERGPVLLVIEDLHWADVASIELLRSSVRHLGRVPLMLLLLARPDARERFPSLWADPIAELTLAPLAAAAAEQIVHDVLGRDPGLDPGRLVHLAGGNPFFLEELIRAAIGPRDVALPDSVVGMVQSRLSRLDPRARRLLRTASVFGRRFSPEGLLALLGERGAEASVRQELARLAELEIVRPSTEFRGEWVFVHALVRDAAYEMLVRDDAVLAHQLAAAWLEVEGGAQPSVVAQHFALGEQPERALVWFERAARLALESTDLQLALQWTTQALDCGAADAVRGRLRALQAEIAVLQADWTRAIECGRDALALLGPDDEESMATYRHLVQALGRSGRSDEMEDVLRQLASNLPAHGHERAIQALCSGITHLVRLGRPHVARHLMRLTEQLMAETEPVGPLTRWEYNNIQVNRADLEPNAWQERTAMLENLGIAERLGTPHLLVEAHRLLGYVEARLGANAEAERQCSLALERASTLGLVHVVYAQHVMLGMLALRRGATRAARAWVERGLALDARDPRLRGALLGVGSMVALAEGDAEQARTVALQAQRCLSAAPPLLAWAHGHAANACVALGDAAGGLGYARAALSIMEDLDGLPEFETDVQVAIVDALLAANMTHEARERLARYVGQIHRHGARIPDSTRRHRFLHDVPANARLLELHAQLGRPDD